MANLLPQWGAWRRTDWGTVETGSSTQPSTGVFSSGVSTAPPAAGEDGSLTITVRANARVNLYLGGPQTSGGRIPNDERAEYDSRVALLPSMALADVELNTYQTLHNTTIGPHSGLAATAEVPEAAAEEWLDFRTENTTESYLPSSGANRGKLHLAFTPEAAGTVDIMMPWYSAADEVPANLAPVAVEIEAPEPTRSVNTVTIPEAEGVDYDPAPGIYELTADESLLEVTASAQDGYELIGPTEWSYIYDESGDSDGPSELAAELAPRVAGYIGKAGNAQKIEQISEQLPIIVAFVYGYTRGSGFDDNDMPNMALKSVIVSAASRVAVNPAQIRQYSIGDYSETPALLVGFTLAEQAILNNYRKRWA